MHRYALARPDTRIEELAGHVLVFNALSWETHILNQAAGAVLQAIAESPKSRAELTALLSDLLKEDEQGAAETHATATVEQLEALALVVGAEP